VEKHGFKMFEKRVHRKMFGPKRSEQTGDWRKLRNEELHDLSSPPNTSTLLSG